MKIFRSIAFIAILPITAAACGSDSSSDADADTTTAAPEDSSTDDSGDSEAPEDEPSDEPEAEPSDEPSDEPSETPSGELSEFGEDPSAADPALVAKALGDVEPADEGSWNIVLSAIARADQDLDQATIDKALECWSNQRCDTGTGGELVFGWADGGGDTVNVWRSVSHMEAILQALTYPEIGSIVSTAANFDADPEVHANDIRFLIQNDVDFIVGYPDVGIALASAVSEAEAAGIPYISFSAGYVGLPGQEGALTPGEDYTAVVGEDLCALGESQAGILNAEVGDGQVAMLGGSPGNALTLGWQRCAVETLEGELVNPPANSDSTTGDTYWVNTFALDAARGLLTTNPEIRGWTYEYSDGMFTALQAYDELNIPVENLTLAMRTDEQTLFCDWAERAEPTYNIWYSAGGNFQSRVSVTASMLTLQGAEVPGEIIVPHAMRQVTEDDCDPNRVNPVVSGTSLVPSEVLAAMFAG